MFGQNRGEELIKNIKLAGFSSIRKMDIKYEIEDSINVFHTVNENIEWFRMSKGKGFTHHTVLEIISASGYTNYEAYICDAYDGHKDDVKKEVDQKIKMKFAENNKKIPYQKK